ncbi:MAG TPA: HIT family protein [Candidatus Nanoarchaeia archaeon]|nr:HIT family protein [Candidatus Nanoarchaeia archaeon]
MKKESCLICQIVEGKVPSYRIAQSERAIAILDINGANPGHCFVIPKAHVPIMEQVSDEDLADAIAMANRVSMALFDAAAAEGTNIFICNGIPAGQTVAHFMVHVIPRKQNDGINLQWQPKKLEEEEASTIELKLKEELKGVAVEKAVSSSRKAAAHKGGQSAGYWEGDDELALRRIP